MSQSSTITADLLANPTPGEILLEEFLVPMGISQNALARAVLVPPRRINEIVLGKRPLPPTQTCALPVISACRKAFSLAFKRTTT